MFVPYVESDLGFLGRFGQKPLRELVGVAGTAVSARSGGKVFKIVMKAI